jgi:hypothetical protein
MFEEEHMNGLDLEKLAADQKECPSDTLLDRYHLEELAAGEGDKVRSHIDLCPRCKQRLEYRKLGFDAHEDLDPARLSNRILSAADERRPKRIWILGGLGAAVAAGLLFMIVWLQTVPEPEIPTVRVKSGLGLTVFRNRQATVVELESGSSCQEGDLLRFRVDLPEDGHLMVAGVEQNGTLYSAYPIGKSESVAVEKSVSHDLPGAARLDDSLGEEWLHLVLCPKTFSLADLSPGGRGELRLPAGCASDSIHILKGNE